MKNNLINILIKLVCLLLLSLNVHSSDDVNDSILQGDNDILLMNEFSSCTDQYEDNDLESNNITSSLLLSGESFFAQGDMIISSTNARAIVDSYDSSTNKLIYYQTAETGFKSFSLGEKLVGKGKNVSIIEEFILDFGVPCSDLVVSIEESPEQMMFIFADSDEAIKAKLAAQEMMAEIEAEMARQAALEAFQAKLADEKAAAAKSTAAYQSKRANDARIAALMDQLNTEKELATFEAMLAAELASQEMMAEIEAEMARQAALEAFQAKLADEKAAAAKSTAAYQSKRANDARIAALMDQLNTEKELATFEAMLAAELASQEMMAEIQAEMARQAALEAFLQKLADEKAAAAASTAAYQASLADEEVIGVIEEVVVTEAAHKACEYALNLSESNIALFKSGLADGTLFNVGPQVSSGTEFTANRWDAYANCVSNYVNPF